MQHIFYPFPSLSYIQAGITCGEQAIGQFAGPALKIAIESSDHGTILIVFFPL
jgi:hypothetical protein